jgi:acyl-CoA reductase-like NAD-dependent aldehyde dehydrogenase
MTKAAKHLTPVALELGSKCPCIVDWLDSKRDSQVNLRIFHGYSVLLRHMLFVS